MDRACGSLCSCLFIMWLLCVKLIDEGYPDSTKSRDTVKTS